MRRHRHSPRTRLTLLLTALAFLAGVAPAIANLVHTYEYQGSACQLYAGSNGCIFGYTVEGAQITIDTSQCRTTGELLCPVVLDGLGDFDVAEDNLGNYKIKYSALWTEPGSP